MKHPLLFITPFFPIPILTDFHWNKCPKKYPINILFFYTFIHCFTIELHIKKKMNSITTIFYMNTFIQFQQNQTATTDKYHECRRFHELIDPDSTQCFWVNQSELQIWSLQISSLERIPAHECVLTFLEHHQSTQHG